LDFLFMSKTASVSTRRRFVGSLICAALGLPVVLSDEMAGQGARSTSPTLPSASTARGEFPREGAIEFESSDSRLVDGFRWAKAQALAYVRNGDSIGPWYEAALPGRDAFCMRDVSHMSTGAQLLGLGARTQNMLRQFAAHISVSKRWCTWWEITKDGKPAPVDYNNDHDFWYDLPANFDVVDACYRQWLWTRDAAYLDEVFRNFYRHTVTDYVREWDHDRNGLLDHLPGDGHMGIGTYDEDLQNEVLVGADLIAAQYAAYRGYSAFERARKQGEIAEQFSGKAATLKSLYNRKWWDASANRYFAAIGEDGKFHTDLKEGTGRSDTELPLYYELTESGPRTQSSLDELQKSLHLDEAAAHGVVGGVEGRSYLPDIFYKYGRSQAGYSVLVAMMDPHLKRRKYPEVSFTVVGNLGAGLMGIRPSSDTEAVETHPQLTDQTRWAAVRHVPVGKNVIGVRHDQACKTTFSNETGPDIVWRASFPGNVDALYIDGKRVSADTTVRLGGSIETYRAVKVGPGETQVVSTSPG
jgi:hypothetical protein